MEGMLQILKKTEEFSQSLQQMSEEFLKELHANLRGPAAVSATVAIQPDASNELPVVTPQQAKKRVKRLSSLREYEETDSASVRKSTRASNSQLLAAAAAIDEPATNGAPDTPLPTPAPRAAGKSAQKSNGKSQSVAATISEEELMPPPMLTLAVPLAPAVSAPAAFDNGEVSFARPQRAAKLKSEKNLKEPKLNMKLRRPNLDSTKVKLEHEQRPSQVHLNATAVSRESSKSSTTSTRSEDSVVVLPQKAPSVVDINSGDESGEKDRGEKVRPHKVSLENDGKTRGLCIKVKREKLSAGSGEQVARCSQESVAAEHEIAALANHTAAVETPVTVQPDVPLPKVVVKAEPPTDESTVASTTLSTTSSVAPNIKKSRKKKDAVPRPIKVEKFSDLDGAAVPPRTRSCERPVETLPIASRTRNRSRSREPAGAEAEPQTQQHQQEEIQKEQSRRSGASVYEDAVDQPLAVPAPVTAPTASTTAELPNATMVIGSAPSDATFCANPAQTTFVVENQNPNATVTMDRKAGAAVGDATFNMPASGVKDEVQHSIVSSRQSMQTAREENDSIITEDESYEQAEAKSKVAPPKAPSAILSKAGKAFKMPTRTNELFNPLVQSPVKKNVEAFENVVAQQTQFTKSGRPKRTKENTAPSSISTPTVGKLGAPSLGRFLTPTQSSNLTPSALAQPKKAPSSASKAMAFPKGTTLKATASASSKPLSRENSADDFRKGLHQLAEERKKQREQKHQLAAQQREAKERERAERMAKLAKEREEKRLKKKQEAEQKKRELEEIQRKLRQQEEAANECSSAKAKAPKMKIIAEQERQLLAQMKPSGKMQPPPPKLQSKYTFEMLHEDDSTDEETKTTYKRPPPPTWSRSHVRGADIVMQQSFPTPIIDSFFSVEPMTPDLRVIFPEIDPRLLKRNSSVLWSTPPRYSELPKY